MAKDVETGATQRHSTFMIYFKGNGRVIHIAHVELAESASAPRRIRHSALPQKSACADRSLSRIPYQGNRRTS